MFKWLGGPRKTLPGGSLKDLFVYLKIRIFKCSYRINNWYSNYDISVYHISINYTIYPSSIPYIIYIYIYIHYTIYPINVGKTIIFVPPNYHFYRWYVYHSQSWVVYDIVLTTYYNQSSNYYWVY